MFGSLGIGQCDSYDVVHAALPSIISSSIFLLCICLVCKLPYPSFLGLGEECRQPKAIVPLALFSHFLDLHTWGEQGGEQPCQISWIRLNYHIVQCTRQGCTTGM